MTETKHRHNLYSSFIPWSLATNAALVADVLSQKHFQSNIADARRHPRIAATAYAQACLSRSWILPPFRFQQGWTEKDSEPSLAKTTVIGWVKWKGGKNASVKSNDGIRNGPALLSVKVTATPRRRWSWIFWTKIQNSNRVSNMNRCVFAFRKRVQAHQALNFLQVFEWIFR